MISRVEWLRSQELMLSSSVSLAPAVGAVLMSLSTTVVAVNAQLLRRTRLF
jgi:cation transport ATPase